MPTLLAHPPAASWNFKIGIAGRPAVGDLRTASRLLALHGVRVMRIELLLAYSNIALLSKVTHLSSTTKAPTHNRQYIL